jgi:voltage-dependent potassium channel beta subunit
MENLKKAKMIYRYLGNSGLKVSAISWGNWINTKDENNVTYDTVKVALDYGVNFFDTAEIYGFGEGETSLGAALKKLETRREDLVISTKIFKSGTGVNDAFLSRKHIVEGLNNSLKRLQLEYVDVVFCHRFDMNTPLEETCRAMNWLIDQGKAFYWGTSEWHASQIMEAHMICEKLGLIKPIVEQCQYNMMVREKMENEYVHLFKTTKMGTTVWSPLFSGVLTGKYINETPKGSRLDAFAANAGVHKALYEKSKPVWDTKLLQLKALAERLGFSLAQLALAWVIKNSDVSTCIVGASKPEQLEENLKSLELVELFTNEIEEEVEKILDNAPQGEMDWLNFNRLPPRRRINLGIRPEERTSFV